MDRPRVKWGGSSPTGIHPPRRSDQVLYVALCPWDNYPKIDMDAIIISRISKARVSSTSPYGDTISLTLLWTPLFPSTLATSCAADAYGFGPTTRRRHPSRLRTEFYSLGLWEIPEVQTDQNLRERGIRPFLGSSTVGRVLGLRPERVQDPPTDTACHPTGRHPKGAYIRRRCQGNGDRPREDQKRSELAGFTAAP